MIELGVLLTADAEKPEVDQPHRGGGHPITIEMRTAQVLRGGRPQVRQRACEPEHMRELLSLPLLPPHRVVAILGPAPAVDARGLDVTKGIGRGPDVLPGWRDTERSNALQRCDVRDPRTGGIPVVNALGTLFANDPRGVRVTARQAWNGGAGGGCSHTQGTRVSSLIIRPIFPPLAVSLSVRWPVNVVVWSRSRQFGAS